MVGPDFPILIKMNTTDYLSGGTDAEEVIARRLTGARAEVAVAPLYRYWVVNDELTAAISRVRAIMAAEECRQERWTQPPLVF